MMVTQFRAVVDEFSDEAQVIAKLVSSFETTRVPPRLRAAASNSAMLLLAATFEGFVRDMAGQVARAAVASAGTVADVPNGILRAAWQRTFDAIRRADVPQNTRTGEIHQMVAHAEAKTDAVFGFLRGNTGRDSYDGLVQNEGNMRPQEINRLFNISQMSDVCSQVSGEQEVIDHFKVDSPNRSATKLVDFINEFIEQRNGIAHALTSSVSVAPSEIRDYIETLCVFADSLCGILERRFAPENAPIVPR